MARRRAAARSGAGRRRGGRRRLGGVSAPMIMPMPDVGGQLRYRRRAYPGGVPRGAGRLRVLGKRRMPGQTRYVKRRRTVKGRSGGSDLSKLVTKERVPRPWGLSRLRTVMQETRILRWQRIRGFGREATPATTIPGEIILQNYENTNTGQPQFGPVMMFELSGTLQATGVTQAECAFYPAIDRTTGDLVRTSIPSQDSSGVNKANSQWEVERQKDPSTAALSRKYVYSSWADIRLICFGATTQPTKWEILIVSFKEGFMDPFELPSNSFEVSTRQAFYQGLLKQMMVSPIWSDPGSANPWKFVRVHKRVMFQSAQSTTNETDVSPPAKEVRIFHRYDRLHDHYYIAKPPTIASKKMYDGGWQVQGDVAADYQARPKPRARRYLIVRALDTTYTSGLTSTQNAQDAPSMDLLIRKKECFARF